MIELPAEPQCEAAIDAPAATSAYVVLAGIWAILGIGYVGIALKYPDGGWHGGAIVLFTVGLLWIVWLRGFRLHLTDDRLVYRNGLYRSVNVSLNEIKEVRNTWIQWKLLGSGVRIPRLVITYGTRTRNLIAVNSKPFRREDLQEIMRQLQAHVATDS